MNNINTKEQVAIVFGVGPGLGLSLVRNFINAGMKVGMVARNNDRLNTFTKEISSTGGQLKSYVCDVTNESDVSKTFANIQKDFGTPNLVVFNAGAYRPAEIIDIKLEDFEKCWRIGCLGGFLVGKEAAKLMITQDGGTILFTGATASLRGSAGFANLAVGKFGLRALAQSMARELGPKNIHVGHVIIDGQILSERSKKLSEERPSDKFLQPDEIAANYLQLHLQHCSAWTLELDLRPCLEKF
jgi:NAD(P)-dependent dehydrogenase (short-subunit alcohol dehydrogenase family)